MEIEKQSVASTDPMDALRALLNTMVPPDAAVIVDVDGGEHRLPACLPLRKQAVLVRFVDGLLGADAIQQARAGDGMGTVRKLITLAVSEEMLDSLDRLIAEVLPSLVPDGQRASDRYPAEELVAALLPFVCQTARRVRALAEAK